MSVLHKILVFILAFSILNQSIDFDYLTYGYGPNQKAANYDDIDTILELLIENIAGDSGFTEDSNDDSGMAQHKGVEKPWPNFQYFEPIKKMPAYTSIRLTGQQIATGNGAGSICKGYYTITSPPPKIVGC